MTKTTTKHRAVSLLCNGSCVQTLNKQSFSLTLNVYTACPEWIDSASVSQGYEAPRLCIWACVRSQCIYYLILLLLTFLKKIEYFWVLEKYDDLPCLFCDSLFS